MTVAGDEPLVATLLARCTFPTDRQRVVCAFSGGPDSTALIVLAHAAGLDVTAFHVDHGLRPSSPDEADRAGEIAAAVGVAFRRQRVTIEPGANLEARARAARHAVLPAGFLTGHTADDQAETVLINLLRGAGLDGLAAIAAGPTHPLLALRRAETVAVCAAAGIEPVRDPSNDDGRFVRNRVRNEVLPLLDDIAGRDVAALVARTAGLLATDRALLDDLAAEIDASDTRALRAAHPALARRALRAFVRNAVGYPPDLATLERAWAVVTGAHVACELGGGRRLARTDGILRIEQR